MILFLPEAIINIADRLTIPFNGFHYSMPLYVVKKLFYEKSINGNLQVSPLFRLVKAYLRSKRLDSFDSVIRSLRERGMSDEKIGEVVSKLQEIQETDFSVRRDTSNASLQAFYQKSKF